MLKFVVGLTDQIDYSGFVYDDQENELSVNYNIRKPTQDIEQATLEWEINTNIVAVKNLIEVWEKIIRIPHLCMINLETVPFKFLPDFNEYLLSVSFINLLPLQPDFIKKFTDDDYEYCVGESGFGDLCIYMYEQLDKTSSYNQNITSAYSKQDISALADASVRGSVLPKFFTEFRLRGNEQPHNWKSDPMFMKFVDEHKETIISKGYDINSNRILNYGPIVIGKLLNDPNEVYENLQKYPRVCRTSFVQT